VIHKISMRDAMVAACAAALIDREGHQTPCLSTRASQRTGPRPMILPIPLRPQSATIGLR
jgi:hypothetical protein